MATTETTKEIEPLKAGTNIPLAEESNLYCLLFGRGDFKPTGNMCRLVVEFMADEENRSPMQILRDQGHAKWNWYKWQKEYPGFLAWWNTVIEDTIKDEHLSRLYLSLYKRALTHDTGAAKLIAQRFDLKYTERSQADIRGVFAGYEPAAADDSRERQRKALAKPAESLPDRTRANACDHKGHTELITGGVEVLPGSTAPIHAQSQSAEHVQDIDNTLTSEPITKVDPPGGGFDI